MELIASKTFTMDDQACFARWSGDTNPMHIDPAAARRTQAGALAVHGVHALLWALDQLPGVRPIATVTARFEKFMTVDQRIELRGIDGETSAKLELRGPNARTARITVSYGSPSGSESAPPPPARPLPEAAALLSFDQAKAGAGAFQMVEADLSEAFPRLVARLGPAPVRGLTALSSLVGMACPGLHSIFSSLSARVVEVCATAPAVLDWRTSSSHDAFSLVSMQASAPGLLAEVEAFMRPAPVEQPKLKDLQTQVDPGRYQGVKALIIGGSRGIGEVTAKLLAAGGADVAITYATGRAEAEILTEEFSARGKELLVSVFDARLPAAPQLDGLAFRPTHVLYFATSKIFRQKSGLFANDLLDDFSQIYATGFFEICQYFSGGQPVKLFYPSSVAVEARPRDMTEYAMAKAAGEVLCDDIDRFMPGVSVLRHRLPRLATDQTATVTAIENVSSVAVMTEILNTFCPGAPD